MTTVKLISGTLYDIKPYLRGFWAVFFLSGTALLAGQLAWSEPVNGLQIAVEAQAKQSQAKVHFRNASEAPLTLLHPDTLEDRNAVPSDAVGAVLAVESVAVSASPSPWQTPFTTLRSEPTGLRQAFILQPGEERSFVRRAPRQLVPVTTKWPGEMELMEREFAPGSQIAYRYANHRATFLGDEMWHGEVVSPPLTWGKKSTDVTSSPFQVRLEPVTEPGHWLEPLRVKLTITNQGPLPIYARLAPRANSIDPFDSRGLWSLLGRDGEQEIATLAQPQMPPAFPKSEHHVVLAPGKSRTWTFQPENWLQLERPGQHRLRLNAQLHWQAARNWEVASALSLLRLEQLEVEPINDVAEVYLPQITAAAR